MSLTASCNVHLIAKRTDRIGAVGNRIIFKTIITVCDDGYRLIGQPSGFFDFEGLLVQMLLGLDVKN